MGTACPRVIYQAVMCQVATTKLLIWSVVKRVTEFARVTKVGVPLSLLLIVKKEFNHKIITDLLFLYMQVIKLYVDSMCPCKQNG